MKFKTSKIVTSTALALLMSPCYAELTPFQEVDICANNKDVRQVQAYLENAPGTPLHLASQALDIPEARVATSLPAESRVSVEVTPDQLKDIWTSIDQWGLKAAVRLVFTLGGQHIADFPSLIPMRQADLDDGWLDIYADNGDGVHGHLQLSPVKTVHAVETPGENGELTRLIGFYHADGSLSIGVYSSIAGEKPDPAAVKGFEATRELLKTLSKVCN